MSYPSISSYITIIRKFKIAHRSVTLSYDTTTNTKKCIHPLGWQKTKFQDSIYEPTKNAIIQNTGPNSNIIVIDVDGTEHTTNKIIIELCKKYCKFYNKTKKGYHFFFLFNDSFPKSQSIKYNNDPTNSGSQSAPGLASAPGIDIKSTGGCVYYGSYYIGKTLVQYENVIAEDIVELHPNVIKELQKIFTKTDTNKQQRKTSKYPNIIINTTEEFPNTTLIDIDTLNKLLMCLPKAFFDDYNMWITSCFLIKHSNHTEPAFQLFCKYSRSIEKYSHITNDECSIKWNSIKYEPNFIPQDMFYLARKHNRKLFNTIQFPWFDMQHIDFQPITFKSQYLNYDEIFPYYQNNKILAIKSPYGTGKTQFISKVFQTLDTDTSILFITPRVSLSYTLLQSFPQFTHYQTKNTNIIKANKLIIQLDSIYKINNVSNNQINILNQDYINKYLTDFTNAFNSNKITYDIVALDELESLLFHLSFDKLNTHVIYNVLQYICVNAKKIIALDGDLSNRGYHFLKNIDQNHTPVILYNQFLPPSSHYIFTNDLEEFEKNIDTDLNKLNIVIICLTLASSEYFYNKYKDKYDTILHNSIQNNRQILNDVNTNWKCKLLIYTSTIESGCDFNIEWFDKSYIVLSNKGTIPRGLMQMCNRVRHFRDNKIMTYNNGVPFYEYQIPYNFQEIKNTLFKHTINPTDNSLNSLNTILCYNELERLNKQYYITILTQLLISKGHTYEYIRKPTKKTIKISNDVYTDIANSDIITSEKKYDKIIELLKDPQINSHDARKYYFMIKKYIISKLWNIDINTIILEDVKRYYPKISKLLNYKTIVKYVKINTNNFNKIKQDTKIRYVTQILQKFKIYGPEQFDFSIDCGPSIEGRLKNKKENPNIISSEDFTNIRTELLTLFTQTEFRLIFDLDKITGNISDRLFLETIKKVICEFGFVITITSTLIPKYENNIRKINRVNSYFIDLDDTIIELLHMSSRDYADDIIDNYIKMQNENNTEKQDNSSDNNTNTGDDDEDDNEDKEFILDF
jgi:hypothetical protein